MIFSKNMTSHSISVFPLNLSTKYTYPKAGLLYFAAQPKHGTVCEVRIYLLCSQMK